MTEGRELLRCRLVKITNSEGQLLNSPRVFYSTASALMDTFVCFPQRCRSSGWCPKIATHPSESDEPLCPLRIVTGCRAWISSSSPLLHAAGVPVLVHLGQKGDGRSALRDNVDDLVLEGCIVRRVLQ